MFVSGVKTHKKFASSHNIIKAKTKYEKKKSIETQSAAVFNVKILLKSYLDDIIMYESQISQHLDALLILDSNHECNKMKVKQDFWLL